MNNIVNNEFFTLIDNVAWNNSDNRIKLEKLIYNKLMKPNDNFQKAIVFSWIWWTWIWLTKIFLWHLFWHSNVGRELEDINRLSNKFDGRKLIQPLFIEDINTTKFNELKEYVCSKSAETYVMHKEDLILPNKTLFIIETNNLKFIKKIKNDTDFNIFKSHNRLTENKVDKITKALNNWNKIQEYIDYLLVEYADIWNYELHQIDEFWNNFILKYKDKNGEYISKNEIDNLVKNMCSDNVNISYSSAITHIWHSSPFDKINIRKDWKQCIWIHFKI